MEKQIYSILDDKSQLFSPPFIANNDAIAIRMVMDILRNPDNNLSRYPDDHKLTKLGAWDEVNGEIYPFDGQPQIVDPVSKIKQLMEQK